MRLAKPSAPVYIYGFAKCWHISPCVIPGKTKVDGVALYQQNRANDEIWQRSHESILCLWKGSKPRIYVNAVREEYTETFLKNAAGKVRKELIVATAQKAKKPSIKPTPKVRYRVMY